MDDRFPTTRARHVDAGVIAAGCTYLSAHIREPGVIHAPGGAHGMTIDGLDGDPTVAAFVYACRRARGRWYKKSLA